MSDTDVKMSNVFNLPINIGKWVLSRLRDDEIKAVSHAINSHDALVEQNKALNEVINEIRAIVTDVQDGFGVTGGDTEILDLINGTFEDDS